jgi:hypothetical protein
LSLALLALKVIHDGELPLSAVPVATLAEQLSPTNSQVDAVV